MKGQEVMPLDEMNKLISGLIATMPIAEGIKVQGLKDHFRSDAVSEGASGRLALIAVGLELLQAEIENLAASELN